MNGFKFEEKKGSFVFVVYNSRKELTEQNSNSTAFDLSLLDSLMSCDSMHELYDFKDRLLDMNFNEVYVATKTKAEDFFK